MQLRPTFRNKCKIKGKTTRSYPFLLLIKNASATRNLATPVDPLRLTPPTQVIEELRMFMSAYKPCHNHLILPNPTRGPVVKQSIKPKTKAEIKAGILRIRRADNA